MLAYSLAPSAGPAIGPIVSGAIKVCGVNWRWAFWVSLIFSAGVLLTAFITLRETYAPVLLSRKANRLRKAWNDERYVAPLELVPFEPKDFFYQVLGKPILMMLQEPMLLVVSMFLAYGAWLNIPRQPSLLTHPPFSHSPSNAPMYLCAILIQELLFWTSRAVLTRQRASKNAC